MGGQMAGQSSANAKNYKMFKEANEFNARQAQIQHGRQQELLMKAPMLQKRGLELAGLNPMLAAMNMSSPSAGGAASAATPPRAENEAGDMAPLISSAVQAAKVKKEAELADQQISIGDTVIKANNSKSHLDNASAKVAMEQYKQAKAITNAVQQEAEVRKATAEKDKEWVGADAWLKRIGGALNSAVGAGGAFLGSLLGTRGRKGGKTSQNPGQTLTNPRQKRLDNHMRNRKRIFHGRP